LTAAAAHVVVVVVLAGYVTAATDEKSLVDAARLLRHLPVWVHGARAGRLWCARDCDCGVGGRRCRTDQHDWRKTAWGDIHQLS
jgi:hypothetical protein